MNGKMPGTNFFNKYLLVAAISSVVLITAISMTAHIIIKNSIVDEAEHHAEEIAEGLSVCELSEIMATSGESGRLVIEPHEVASLDKELREFLQPFNILHIKIFDHEGFTLFSTDTTQIGLHANSPGLHQAMNGIPSSIFEAHGHLSDMMGKKHKNTAVVETYVPLLNANQEVVGIFELYTNVQSHLSNGRQTFQTLVFTLSLLVMLVFIVHLYLVHRMCKHMNDTARQETANRAELVQAQQHATAANIKLQAANNQLKATEKETKALAQNAILADAAKTAFLTNMSHEMRTPLTAILGYTDLLADADSSPATKANNVAVIQRNGKHLLSLIEDILDLATIEEGRMLLQITACKTLTFAEEIQTMARFRAREHNLGFEMTFRTAVPELIFTDTQRLKQALLNLISNAVKFTHEGAIRLEIEYQENKDQRQPMMLFHVHDTGIGINGDVMEDLFQPFTQVDEKSNREFGGSGLGLTITRQIAKVLGGEISASSTPGQGSCFVLAIAAGNVAEQPLVTPENNKKVNVTKTTKPTIDLTGLKILYAEDGLDNQFLVKAILRKAGAGVDIAGNGAVAVEMTKAKTYDMILMDIQMPIMDGLEATRIIRDMGYTRSIVALTANALANDYRLSNEAGCVEHLTKPINRQILLRTVLDHCQDLARC